MPTTLRPYAFVLAAPDLGRSVRSFRDVLSFQPEWGDGINWRAPARDGVRVMIGHCPNAMTPADTGDHCYFGYVEVDDVDALYAEIAARSSNNHQPTNIGADARWPSRHPTAIVRCSASRSGNIILGVEFDYPRRG